MRKTQRVRPIQDPNLRIRTTPLRPMVDQLRRPAENKVELLSPLQVFLYTELPLLDYRHTENSSLFSLGGVDEFAIEDRLGIPTRNQA